MLILSFVALGFLIFYNYFQMYFWKDTKGETENAILRIAIQIKVGKKIVSLTPNFKEVQFEILPHNNVLLIKSSK